MENSDGQMTHEVVIEAYWDSAHQLSLPYASKCNNLHGHRYRVLVRIAAERLNSQGMVIDFVTVKQYLKQFDHVNLNDHFNPSTAENIAARLLENLANMVTMENNGAHVVSVEVSETRSTAAIAKWSNAWKITRTS